MSYEYMHPEPTDTSTVYTLDDLRRIIVPLVAERGMGNARVFGSYARGEATPESDIDLLVDKGSARYLALCGLAGAIYEATGKLPDVYDVSQLKDGQFRDEVLKESVIL